MRICHLFVVRKYQVLNIIRGKRNTKVRMMTRKLDLSGPKGNAFVILGLANDLGKQLGIEDHGTIVNRQQIQTDMQSGDYNNLLRVFKEYFGDHVTFTSPHELDGVDGDLYSIEESEWI